MAIISGTEDRSTSHDSSLATSILRELMLSSIQLSLSSPADSTLFPRFNSTNRSLTRWRSDTSLPCCCKRLLISTLLLTNFALASFKFLSISRILSIGFSCCCTPPLKCLVLDNNSPNKANFVSRMERNPLLSMTAFSNMSFWITGGISLWTKGAQVSCTQERNFEISLSMFCVSVFSFSSSFSFPKASSFTSSHFPTTMSNFLFGSRSVCS